MFRPYRKATVIKKSQRGMKKSVNSTVMGDQWRCYAPLVYATLHVATLAVVVVARGLKAQERPHITDSHSAFEEHTYVVFTFATFTCTSCPLYLAPVILLLALYSASYKK